MLQQDEEVKHPPPKRAGSAWLYFNTEFSKRFVEEGGDRTQAFSAASTRWSEMSEAERAPYVQQSEKAKAVVEEQKKELKAKGYYTLEDGSKSTDPQNAHLLKVKKKKRKDLGSGKQKRIEDGDVVGDVKKDASKSTSPQE